MAFSQFLISTVDVISVVISVAVAILVLSVVISRASIAGGLSRMPRWKRSPGFGTFWQQGAGVEEAVKQLIPVFFVGDFMDPIS